MRSYLLTACAVITVFITSNANASLIGDLASEVDTSWSGYLVTAAWGQTDPTSNLLDGNNETPYRWYITSPAEPGAADNSVLTMSFDKSVAFERISIDFWVTNTNGTVPNVELYADPEMQIFLGNADEPGVLNAGNGHHPRSFFNMDTTLSSVTFKFTRADGTPSGARNLVMLGEIDVYGTAVPEPVTLSSLSLVFGYTLMRRKKK